MNTQPQSEAVTENLTRERWDVPIRVRLEPYVAFGRTMDEELEKLVRQWRGKAAPCALLIRR